MVLAVGSIANTVVEVIKGNDPMKQPGYTVYQPLVDALERSFSCS